MAKKKSKTAAAKPKCGLVMPISECAGLPPAHWLDVRQVYEQALGSKYDVALVSDRPDVGVIHESIVVKLFDCPIVVCDVSGHNANVMLELGIRLAADKPVVIVRDDQTKFAFDVAPIKHLTYPRDLRHRTIQDFQKQLSDTVKATLEAAIYPHYSPFLKNFKRYEAKKELEKIEETGFERLERKLDELIESKRLISDVEPLETPWELDARTALLRQLSENISQLYSGSTRPTPTKKVVEAWIRSHSGSKERDIGEEPD